MGSDASFNAARCHPVASIGASPYTLGAKDPHATTETTGRSAHRAPLTLLHKAAISPSRANREKRAAGEILVRIGFVRQRDIFAVLHEIAP